MARPTGTDGGAGPPATDGPPSPDGPAGLRTQPRQHRSRQRVATILEAARELLGRGGVERCTIGNLAEAAGVSAASIYRYFPDRTDVLRALAELTLDEVHLVLDRALTNIHSRASAEEALRLAVATYRQGFQEDRALRELWAGTLVDPVLVAMNVADSRRNGALVAERVGPWSSLAPEVLQRRAFLLAHLTGAAITLSLELPDDEAAAIEAELGVYLRLLFDEA